MTKLDLSKTHLATLVQRCTELTKLVLNAPQSDILIPASATLMATELVYFSDDNPESGDVGLIWE